MSTEIKKSIYQIQQDYLQLMAAIEDAEGEITDEQGELLSINQAELEEKAINYGYIIKQYDAELAQIKAEVERLNTIAKAKVKIQAALKERITDALLGFQVLKVSKNNLTLSFRKSKSLVVEEGAYVPPEYINTKEVETIDKMALKKAVEEGQEFAGIYIHENQNLQIK